MPTRKRAPSKNTYAVALKHAEKEYAKKLKERDAASADLARLNGELPNLESMIRVLKNQLHPSAAAPYLPPAVWPSDGAKPAHPANGEVPEGAGSILANADGSTPQQTTPDIDSIPGMEGEWT